MQQIFDEQLHTPELTAALQKIAELDYSVTITCEWLTTTEFFNLLKKVMSGLYTYVYANFKRLPFEINRCDSITNAIKHQIPLPIPYITPEAIPDVFPVDGCHRMYVCEKLFEPDTKFPVLVITPTKKEDTI